MYHQYEPPWPALSPKTREHVPLGSYARLFDDARRRVRAWEGAKLR